MIEISHEQKRKNGTLITPFVWTHLFKNVIESFHDEKGIRMGNILVKTIVKGDHLPKV